MELVPHRNAHDFPTIEATARLNLHPLEAKTRQQLDLITTRKAFHLKENTHQPGRSPVATTAHSELHAHACSGPSKISDRKPPKTKPSSPRSATTSSIRTPLKPAPQPSGRFTRPTATTHSPRRAATVDATPTVTTNSARRPTRSSSTLRLRLSATAPTTASASGNCHA